MWFVDMTISGDYNQASKYSSQRLPKVEAEIKPEGGEAASIEVAEDQQLPELPEDQQLPELPEDQQHIPLPMSPVAHSPIRISAEEAKLKAQQEILQQLDSDFAAVGGLTNISSTIAMSANAGDLADMTSSILGGLNSLQITNSAFSDMEMIAPSVDILSNLGSGFLGAVQLAALIPKSQEWSKIHTSISTKQAELSTLPPPGDASHSVSTDERRDQLTREIEELKGRAGDLVKDTALGLISSGVAFSSDTLSTTSTILGTVNPAATQATAAIGVASGVLGVGGSVLGMGMTTYGLYQTNKEFKAILGETDRLLANLQEPDLDPALKMVIDMRLSVLEQKYDDAMVSVIQDSMALGCSTLGGIAGATSLGLAVAGVGTGLAATAATTAGIGAAVLGIGLLAGGLGYAAYKNRKTIELRLSQASQSSQGMVDELRLNRTNSSIKETGEITIKVQNKIREIRMKMEVKKQAIESQIDLHDRLIKRLVATTIQPKSTNPKIQERIREKLDKEFKITRDLYQRLDNLETKTATQLEKQIERMGQLQAKVNVAFAKISRLNKEIDMHKRQADTFKMEAKIASLSQKFARLTENDLKQKASFLVEAFHDSDDSKKSVKKFIAKEGYVVSNFADNSIGTIFAYLTSDVKEGINQ